MNVVNAASSPWFNTEARSAGVSAESGRVMLYPISQTSSTPDSKAGVNWKFSISAGVLLPLSEAGSVWRWALDMFAFSLDSKCEREKYKRSVESGVAEND